MRTTRWWALLVMVLASAWLLPMEAFSQRTGGSFGGSRWGSGSSRPSSGSWSRPSSSGSWSRPSYSTGGGGYGRTPIIPIPIGVGSNSSSSGDGGLGGLCCVLFFIAAIVLVIVLVQRKNASTARLQQYPPMGGPMPMVFQDTFAVAVLAIAFDSRARAQIQAGVGQIAQRSNLAPGGNGLALAAQETAQLLGQFLDAAYMTQHAVSEGITMQAAQQYFESAVNDARGRFLVETMRNDAGGVRRVQGPQSTARAEEGGGFVVVTIVVARRGGFFGFRPPTDRQTLGQDLFTVLQGDANLNAMEVVWQPSDENDVMSSAEMAQVFPALRPIDPDARVQRRACAYCKTVFAAELRQCPNCGAPAA